MPCTIDGQHKHALSVSARNMPAFWDLRIEVTPVLLWGTSKASPATQVIEDTVQDLWRLLPRLERADATNCVVTYQCVSHLDSRRPVYRFRLNAYEASRVLYCNSGFEDS